jgi:DNA polymerase-1
MATVTKPLLLLVDGHSLAFRSFYAFSKGGDGGLSTKEGIPTSVTFGFLKVLLETAKEQRPQGVVIAFDTAEPTFRHELDEAYKAHREEAPEQFFQDLNNLQQILSNCLDIPLCMAPGYEADDVLGTLALQAAAGGWRVRILSGDRDLFQLVDDNKEISVLYLGGSPYTKSSGPTPIHAEDVLARLGVVPEEVVELKALTGDSSDNIPGVKGVGPKTAITLLRENGNLDGIYGALESLSDEKASKGALKGALKQKLSDGKENAYRSRKLARILVDVPLPQTPRLELGQVRQQQLESELQNLELQSLARQAGKFVELFSTAGTELVADVSKPVANVDELTVSQLTVAELIVDNSQSISNPSSLPPLQPELINSTAALETLLERLNGCSNLGLPVALDSETTDLNPFQAQLVGLGFCWGEGMGDLAYIPIGHLEGEQLPLDQVLAALAPWLASDSHPKCLQNAKFDRLVLLRHGLELGGVVMDTLLADYLRDAGDSHSLDELAQRHFGFRPTGFKDIVAKGDNFASVAIPVAALYCGMDVHLTYRLTPLLRQALVAMGEALPQLLDRLELPLEPVLAGMEATGIRIDIAYLQELGSAMGQQLTQLEADARKAAGVEFNLASPKQLGELLFDTLGLERRKSRKNKTGWSTDAAVLEKLEADHPVVPLVLEHRTLSKLKSTYVDALPALVEPETGRVHTDFNQTVTATGRLSSSNPNLQNIPIRTAFSRQIRKAFLPQQGWTLLSADYSQIELRILTHLSGEEVLIEAFNNNDDVHALTARLLLDKQEINADERRLGKTINFGVIYGMGAQRFARETGVSQAEAKLFLSRYRERYPKVFAFLELQERLALSRGYVETLLGRRRPFHFDPQGLGRLRGKAPEQIDLEVARRGGMEAQQLRAAANAPIQGSSADIIKLAMVALQAQLISRQLPARLLLQVHDELVLECDPAAEQAVKDLVTSTMEQAARLSVPLRVDISSGPNWMEAK